MTETEVSLVTIPEAARLLGVAERTLRRWVAKGTLTSVPDPTDERRWLVQSDVLEQFRVSRKLIGHQRPPADTHGTVAGQLSDSDRTLADIAGHMSDGEKYPWEQERAALTATIEDLKADKAWLQGQIESQQSHATELARLLEQEQHQRAAIEARIIRALPAPASPTDIVQDAQPKPEPEPVQEDNPAPRRPWWRFGL